VEVVPFAADEPSPDLLLVAELADCAATVLARDGKAILSIRARSGLLPAPRADRSPRFLRLTFAAVPADEIPEGIARLARAAHALLEGRAA